jgi:antitoxin component YwqK of YwqJK toxin-antitoxin module
MNGEKLTWYPSGELNEKFNYVNGKKHGECFTFYRTGKILTHLSYVNGIEHTYIVDQLDGMELTG